MSLENSKEDIIVSSNGDVQYGYFIDGLLNGSGKIVYKNGDTYIGEFKDGKYHGQGILENKHSKIEGTFINGELVNGKKISIFDDIFQVLESQSSIKNYEYYKGSFKNGKYEGDGELKKDGEHYNKTNLYRNDVGEYYNGQFVNGVYEGIGTLHIEEKYYIGEFMNGKFHGKGILTLSYPYDSIVYDGEFIDGKFIKGTIKEDMVMLEGNFIDEQLEGDGIFEDKMYNYKYIGKFKQGKFHGEGKLYKCDSLRYDGEFIDGYFNINGTLIKDWNYHIFHCGSESDD